MTLLTLALAIAPAFAGDEPLAVPVLEPAVEPAAPKAESPPVSAPTAPAVPAATASELYLQALGAWKNRDFTAALRLSTEAVNTDPLLGEAWLLRSYAHMRLDDEPHALASVKLARQSTRTDVRAAARSLEARLTQVYRRDSPSLSLGLGPQLELRYGDAAPHVALSLGVGVPVYKHVSAAAEVRWTALDPGVLGVAGARASALATLTLPIGSGRWSFIPAVGPSLWLATGQYWSDGSQPYLGARLNVELDGRFTPAFGMFLGVGTEFYPGQSAELSWLAEPFEARTGLRFWFWGG